MEEKKSQKGEVKKMDLVKQMVIENLGPLDDEELEAFLHSEQFRDLFPDLYCQLNTPDPCENKDNVSKSGSLMVSEEVVGVLDNIIAQIASAEDKIRKSVKAPSSFKLKQERESKELDLKSSQGHRQSSRRSTSYKSSSIESSDKKLKVHHYESKNLKRKFTEMEARDSPEQTPLKKVKLTDSFESKSEKKLPIVLDVSESSSTSTASTSAAAKWSYKPKRKANVEVETKQKKKLKTKKLGDVRSKSKTLDVKKESHVKASRRRKDVVKAKTPKKESKVSVKPYSFYSRNAAKFRVHKPWTPKKSSEFDTYQKKFKLKMCWVPCVNLLNLETFFHKEGSSSQPKCLTSKPLKSGVRISDAKLSSIAMMEKWKIAPFKKILNKKYASSIKPRKNEVFKVKKESKTSTISNLKKERSIVCLDISSSSENDSLFETVVKKESKNNKNDNFIPRYKKPIANKADVKESDVFSKAFEAGDQNKIAVKKEPKVHSPKKIVPVPTRIIKSSPKGEGPLVAHETITVKNNVFNRPLTSTKQVSRPALVKPSLPVQHYPHQKLKLFRPQPRPKVVVNKYPIPKADSPPSRGWRPTIKEVVAKRVDRIRQQIITLQKEEACKPKVELLSPITSDLTIVVKQEVPKVETYGVAWKVDKMLSRNVIVEIPELLPECDGLGFLNYTVQKIVWWILKSEADPADEVLFHPELNDEEESKETVWYDFGGGNWCPPDDDNCSLGAVSDDDNFAPTGNYTEPKYDDPDRIDEFCGLTTLTSHFRRAGTTLAQNQFKKVFAVQPGTNYEKSFFNAKCFLCDEKVVGQRTLGAHVRGQRHQNNFRNYSLKMANYEETRKPTAVKSNTFLAKLKVYTDAEIASAECILPEVKSDDDFEEDVAARKAENKPVSPNEDLPLPTFEDYDIKEDHEQTDAKLKLRLNNQWNATLEAKWKRMKEEEAIIIKNFNETRTKYIEEPDSHPCKNEEWLGFWEVRCLELDIEGINPDNYDFSREWLTYWFKRVQEILKAEAELEILNMKKRLGVDTESLKKMMQEQSRAFSGGRNRYNGHRIPGISVPAPVRDSGSRNRGAGSSSFKKPYKSPYANRNSNSSNNHNRNKTPYKNGNQTSYRNQSNSPSPNRFPNRNSKSNLKQSTNTNRATSTNSNQNQTAPTTSYAPYASNPNINFLSMSSPQVVPYLLVPPSIVINTSIPPHPQFQFGSFHNNDSNQQWFL